MVSPFDEKPPLELRFPAGPSAGGGSIGLCKGLVGLVGFICAVDGLGVLGHGSPHITIVQHSPNLAVIIKSPLFGNLEQLGSITGHRRRHWRGQVGSAGVGLLAWISTYSERLPMQHVLERLEQSCMKGSFIGHKVSANVLDGLYTNRAQL